MRHAHSLRNPKLELNADNVVELDALFDRLDKDGGGSLDLAEVKTAMKVMVNEAASVDKATKVSLEQEAHWRKRTALMEDCAVSDAACRTHWAPRAPLPEWNRRALSLSRIPPSPSLHPASCLASPTCGHALRACVCMLCMCMCMIVHDCA